MNNLKICLNCRGRKTFPGVGFIGTTDCKVCAGTGLVECKKEEKAEAATAPKKRARKKSIAPEEVEIK